jgi:calcium-dependent protein kinase
MGCCETSFPNSDVQEVDFRREFKEATGTAMSLSIRQRISDILFPILRKVFVHSFKGLLDETYEVHEILGQGSFSTVRRAVHIQNRIERAVKIIAKNSISQSQQLLVIDEVDTLKALDHPNIIRVIEIIEDTAKLNIVTELCTGGELFERIIQSELFTENTAASFMYQILSGLIHIHAGGFIHRDLKPENILFLNKSDDMQLKIIDFGVSKRLSSTSKLTRFIGTVKNI